MAKAFFNDEADDALEDLMHYLERVIDTIAWQEAKKTHDGYNDKMVITKEHVEACREPIIKALHALITYD